MRQSVEEEQINEACPWGDETQGVVGRKGPSARMATGEDKALRL